MTHNSIRATTISCARHVQNPVVAYFIFPKLDTMGCLIYCKKNKLPVADFHNPRALYGGRCPWCVINELKFSIPLDHKALGFNQ